MYTRLAFSIVSIAAIFFVSHYVFTPMHLYYELPWIDKPMHLVGGATTALLLISLHLLYYNNRKPVELIYVVFSTLLVACGWELYEYGSDYMHERTWNGWYDSVTDILYGITGGYVAYYLHKYKYL